MAEKIRYPRLFRAFSWTLLAVGLASLLAFTRATPLENWLPLAAFIPLVLIADRFAIRMPGDIYLSLETTFHLACALILVRWRRHGWQGSAPFSANSLSSAGHQTSRPAPPGCTS